MPVIDKTTDTAIASNQKNQFLHRAQSTMQGLQCALRRSNPCDRRTMAHFAAIPEKSARGWSRLDWGILGALACLCLWWVHRIMDWRSVPFEDAAMLLRYSQNFAQGHGIRWNIGQNPVDGATDFLYMIVTGLVSRVTHLDVIASSRVLTLTSWAALVFMIYIGSRILFRSNPWVSAWVAAYFIAGPGVQLARACFGASMFACALCLAWLAANWFIERRGSIGRLL